MGSRFLGVPLSATQMAPKVMPLNNNNDASTGIRAPITLDDSDFEYSGSSKSRENSTTSSYYSGSDIESEGSRSGDDDELESFAERPYVADKKTLFVGEHAFPRPSSKSNELAQESSSSNNSNDRGFSSPSVVKSGEGFAQVSGRVNRNANFRPFVRTQDKISDEGAGANSGLYFSESDELVEEDDYVPKYKKFRPAVPIALISRDSDDDSRTLGSEFSDDDGFLGGTVMVPKVKISELDVFPDNEYLAKNDSEMEFVGDLAIDDAITCSNEEIEMDNNGVEGPNLHALSSATIQDEVSDAESRVDSHFAGEVHMLMSEPEKNEFSVHSDEEVQEFDPLVLSEDFLESVLPGNISSAPSSEKMGFECEFVELGEPDVTELDHNNDFREAAPCNDDDLESDKNIEKEVLETDSEQESFAFSSEEILQDQTQPIISDSDTTIPMIQAKSNNEFTGTDESDVTLSEGEQKQLKKIQQVRVKYLRLLHRLGFSHRDPVATQVLHQLNVAEAKFAYRVFDLHSAEEESMKFESCPDEDSDSSLNILVIGKTGVGKSATINSIFGETKTSVNAFQPTTTDVKEINGIIHGVRVTVFDTPGLRTSTIDQSINRKVLISIEKTVRKRLIDVVLYVDRLDSSIGYLNDLPMFKAIASCLGSSTWSKSILVLTHASSLPPDGSEGAPLSYETLVSEWSRAVQQLISRSCGEMNPISMALVSAVENNPFSENDENGDTASLGGERWRLNLLLLCYSMKTLSEVHSIASINHSGLPSLSFLQSNAFHKLSRDPTTDNVYSDVEAHFSLSYQEKDDECDYISSFKPLTRSQIAKRGQRFGDLSETASRNDFFKAEIGRDDDVAVFLRDEELPHSFRYRFSEPSPQILARPVLSSHGWDHDRSYDGVLIEYELDIADRVLKPQAMFRNFKKNTTDAGMSFTYPIDEIRASLGLSFMRHRGEIICACNLESRFSLSRRNSKLCVRAGLNNKRSGRISIKTSCSDQLQLGAIALLPIASAIFKKIFFPSNEKLLV